MSVQSAALPLPADRARVLRTLGGVGIAAGLLFAAMSVWQHAAGLESGTWYAVNQAGFAVAMVGYVALLLGLHVARPGGDGWPARFFTALLAAAWVVFLAGMAVQAVTTVDSNSDVLGPVGGLAQAVGLVGVGVVTVRARRWSGLRRYVPLTVAAVYVAVLFVPAILGADTNAVTETLWALGYSGLGLALIDEQDRKPGSASRGRYAVAAVLAAAAVTTAAVVPVAPSSASSTVAPSPARSTSRPVVGSSPLDGSANNLEHRQSGSSTVATVPTDGSANNREHRQSESSTVAPVPTDGSANNLEHREQEPAS